MKLHTHSLRVIHKWIGLVIGLQLVLWTVSGAGMALLDMDEVHGGDHSQPARPSFVAQDAWPRVRAQLAEAPVDSVALRPLLDRFVYEVGSGGRTMLFDAATGEVLTIDKKRAASIALADRPERLPIRSVMALDRVSLAVRDHALPIWRVDFDDPASTSVYVSASSGAVLERRNDTWRLWDVLWMLHSMDYAERKDFNHPLIITVGFAAFWLAITGVWLLFRTGWRSDFRTLRSGGTRPSPGPGARTDGQRSRRL